MPKKNGKSKPSKVQVRYWDLEKRCVLPPGQKGWPPMDFGAYFKSDDYRRDQAKQRAEMKKISKSSGRLVLY